MGKTEEQIAAEKAELAKKEAIELAEKAKELAEKEKADAEKEADEKLAAEKKALNDTTTYIMNVTHLSWGYNKKSHFYAEKKPVISKKLMGKYHGEIDVWLKAGWVKKGSYKK